jgi:hypothetical protein
MGSRFLFSGVNQLWDGLLAVAVVVDVAGALEGDCVLWKRGTLLRLRLANGRLRGLAGVGCGTAAYGIDHRDNIGNKVQKL